MDFFLVGYLFLNGYSFLDVLFYWTNRCDCGLWEHFPVVGIDPFVFHWNFFLLDNFYGYSLLDVRIDATVDCGSIFPW